MHTCAPRWVRRASSGFALKPTQKNNDAGRTRRYLIKAVMMGGVLRLFLRLSSEKLIGPTGRCWTNQKGMIAGRRYQKRLYLYAASYAIAPMLALDKPISDNSRADSDANSA